MRDDDFYVDLEPVEDMYGGGSRTRHIMLKRRNTTLTQSVFSCPIGNKIAPNRDYPYEGLFSVINGRYWKFIDTIAIGLNVKGKSIALDAASVRASPWDCTYTYKGEGLSLEATYFLYDTCHGSAGVLDVEATGPPEEDTSIVFEPYFDIRFMYDTSVPDKHVSRVVSGRLEVTAGGPVAYIEVGSPDYIPSHHEIDWVYKLGSGFRGRSNGDIYFIPEVRRISSFYEIKCSGNYARLKFFCSGDEAGAIRLAGMTDMAGPTEDVKWARHIRDILMPGYTGTPMGKNVLFRVIGMMKFGMDVDGIIIPEAGDFWFKTVWFRDVFEGLINNYGTIKKLGCANDLKDILLRSYLLQDSYGRIPNLIVPGRERPDYNSADAILLAFILAGMVVRDTNDGELAQESAAVFKRYISGLSTCELSRDGPPVIRPNGLLSVSPWHSWIDAKRDLRGYKLPERVSEAWEDELIDMGATDELFMPKFFLPEINAQWLRALECGWLFSRYSRDYTSSDRYKKLYYKGMGSYKPLFYNNNTGFINNLVTTDDFILGRKVDDTAGSPGMVASVILGTDVFSMIELRNITEVVKEKLLRTKWGIPFGIIVRDSDESIYYNDNQYHEAVVWPRDTPYLVRLLNMVGEKNMAGDIIKANLRHQMEEGVLFYNNELFSCDHDCVPVKDPVQWWSQWTDVCLEYLQGSR